MLHILLLLLTMLAGSCGSERGSDDPLVGPGGRHDPLFVSVEVSGGTVPVGHDFRSLPRSVVYDDGRTFSPGPTTAIYPGPAVLPVVEGELTDRQLRELLEAAAEAELIEGGQADLGEPPVADAATTTITVVVDGQEHVTSVYGLEEAGSAFPGMEQDEHAGRAKVRAFLDRLSRLVSEAEQGQYEPERYRVLPLEPRTARDEALDPDEREWPLDQVELTAGECSAVTGEQAAELRTALGNASEITRWRTDSGEKFALAVRPVLPHEPRCPA